MGRGQISPEIRERGKNNAIDTTTSLCHRALGRENEAERQERENKDRNRHRRRKAETKRQTKRQRQRKGRERHGIKDGRRM